MAVGCGASGGPPEVVGDSTIVARAKLREAGYGMAIGRLVGRAGYDPGYQTPVVCSQEIGAQDTVTVTVAGNGDCSAASR